MSRYSLGFASILLIYFPQLAHSQGTFSGKPNPAVSPTLRDQAVAALTSTLRGLIVEALPNPLYAGTPGWGKTARTVVGVKKKAKGIGGKYKEKNHGAWRKVRITSLNPEQTLAVNITDWKHPDQTRTTFTVHLAMNARVDLEQQQWNHGVRLFSGSARARLRVHLKLECESTTILEKKSWWFPDLVIRLKVTKADLRYDNLIVEHLAGFGGTPAKVVGERIAKNLRKWHPSLERNLTTRANAAIVKAGDTKEIRLGLSQMMKKTTGK